jgi:hypothetical protein
VESAGFGSARPPTVHATVEPLRIVKTELKRLGRPFVKPTTAQFFRRL